MAKNKKYNLDEAPTRNADGSYNINYNGDNYTIQPSALNSGNITVTTPEVVVKGKRPYSPYSFGTYVPFEYSRNSYYRPEDALEAFNTITGGGLNWVDPTQWARRAIDLVPLATGNMSMSEYGDRWINGNEGLVTANFAKNHPIASMLFNGVVGGLPYAKALNYTTRAKDVFGDYVKGHMYPLVRPRVPENFITIKPKIRTRVGDVEIDTPNVLYHTDWGDGIGAMAKINEVQGLPTHGGPTIINGFLYPGASYTEGQKAYSWWNLGRPWNTPSLGSRLTTTNVDNPLLFPVRSSKEPIGQWNGKKGFVTKKEYVANKPIDVSNSTYVYDPNYGWRKVSVEEAPTIKWADAVKSPQITVENDASMTPAQWTAAQDAAIARGDMAEAQRLRDLHFQVSAPNTQIKDIQYHGAKGNAKFNVFNPKLIGQTDKGWAGRGYYFTPSEDYAKMYGSEPRAFYINAKKVHDGKAATYFGRENGPEANAFKIIRKRHNNDGQQILDELASSDAIRTSFPQTQPYNGIFEEMVTRNNNQMKLADAVTYNDNGVRIPLGERDNFNINDIRYGLLPFGIGLTGYGLSQRKKHSAGGSIHIAPSKRGTFTAAATKHGMSVQEFANKVLRNKNEYSPSLVKKANFARNASKWH